MPLAANGTLAEEILELGFGQPQALEAIPFVAGPDVHRGAEGVHLRRGHQAGVIVLVAGERQAEALDGVAEEADRAVVVDAAEGVEQRRQVVAAEIGHQLGQLIVGAALDQAR